MFELLKQQLFDVLRAVTPVVALHESEHLTLQLFGVSEVKRQLVAPE